jgi:phenylalanyl-tRNA synthetase alpha chain
MSPAKPLLRTHTSSVQIRVMEVTAAAHPHHRAGPRVSPRQRRRHAQSRPSTRSRAFTWTSNVTVGDLKGTVEAVFKELLGSDVKLRFRPHYFSYTEPSLEIDFTNALVKKLGKDWLEIAGCGMVHPQVFENVGYDPEVWSGWAFGFGIERIAMLALLGITDIRLFYGERCRFLSSCKPVPEATPLRPRTATPVHRMKVTLNRLKQ